MQVTPAHDPILTTPSHLAHALLARAHSPTTATKLFTTKIKQKPLLLHASSPSDKRALRRHVRTRRKQYFLRKQKPQALSAKEKRSLGVHDLQRKECKYAIYRGLHRMWVGYIREVLGLNIEPATNRLVTQQGHGSLLASADFHGAEVQVARSTCVDRVGLKGIVVRDTKFTFVIVTSQDEVKTVPKKDTVFRFEIPMRDSIEDPMEVESADTSEAPGTRNLVFELHGNLFAVRPADRANKKFKWKITDCL